MMTAIPPLTRRTKASLLSIILVGLWSHLPERIKVGVVKVGISGTKIEVWDKNAYSEYLATTDAWKGLCTKRRKSLTRQCEDGSDPF